MPLPLESATLSLGSVFSVLLNIGVVFAPAFQLAAAVAILILLVRLFRVQLAAKYWAVCALLVASIPAGFIAMLGGPQAVTFHTGGDVLHLALATIIFWELSHQVFRNYPALAEFSTRSLKYILPLCALLGVWAFLTDPDVPEGRSPHLHMVIAIDRGVTSALLAYLLATGAFAGWFPVRMTRNAARLLIGFMILFAVRWASALLANTAPEATVWANSLETFTTLLIASYWAYSIDAAGEVEVSATVPQWDPDRLAEMTQQLDQMQAQLSRRGY